MNSLNFLYKSLSMIIRLFLCLGIYRIDEMLLAGDRSVAPPMASLFFLSVEMFFLSMLFVFRK